MPETRFYKQNHKLFGERAQSMIEFALVFPILLALLLGIFEFGRYVFTYASVTNASREAVRFGSAIGFEDTTYNHKYQYCSGIRETAKKTAFLTRVQDSDVVIQYDHGPGTSVFDECPAGVTTDKTIVVKMGTDRVKVTVTGSYSPMTRLLPISQRTIASTSYRTILGNTQIGP